MKRFTGLGDVVVAYPETDKIIRLTHAHVWAFAKYCLSVKPEGEFAKPEDFELDALHAWRDHLLIVDYLDADDDFRYRYYGAGVQVFTGFDMTGRRVSDFDSEVGRFFDRLYRRCIREKCLIYSEHDYVHARRPCHWSRVLCPVRDGERTFVVVCNYPIAMTKEDAAALKQRHAAC